MVIQNPLNPLSAKTRGAQAILYLEKKAVGVVTVKGWETSWGFGEFSPDSEFASFATMFGHWSLLMHADNPDERLSRAAAQELSLAEARLDSLKAKLFFPAEAEWVDIAQLTIDGELLEWKVY